VPELREIAAAALDAARAAGAAHAEARIVETSKRRMEVRSGTPAIDSLEDAGSGVRALVDGACGFAAGPRLGRDELAELSGRACAAAKLLSRAARGNPIDLVPAPAVVDHWQTPCVVDPFSVPLEEVVELLRRCETILRERGEIVDALARIVFIQERSRFASTEGSWIEGLRTLVGARLEATASAGGKTVSRSFLPEGGATFSGGYELLEGLRLPARAAALRDEAIDLLSAPPCPGGRRDLIVAGPALAELLASTLLVPRKGERLASEVVRLVADAALPGGLATAPYDDEGVATSRFALIEAGVSVASPTTRELARSFGETASRGCARSHGWKAPPQARAPSLVLLPGTWALEDLIADTREGVLCEALAGISVDGASFHAAAPAAWEIRDGRRGRRLRGASWAGSVGELWRACDAIGSEPAWQVWPARGISVGAAPVRFRGASFLELA
jgi:TldD protein